MIVNEHLFTDMRALKTALTEALLAALSKAISIKGHAVMALPGGTTPVPLFKALAKKKFNWCNVTITLTDERWVKNTHKNSNEGLLRTHLLDYCNAVFVPLKNDASTAKEGQRITEQKLSRIIYPMDICIVGMGEDGHIASIFPDSPQRESAIDQHSDQHCIAISRANSPQERLSLTLNTLINTHKIILLIQGDQKRKVYLKAKDSIENTDSPIGRMLHQSQAPIDVYWTA